MTRKLAPLLLSLVLAFPALAQDSARERLIADLVVANHILYRQGVVDGFGHVSVRDPDHPDHFLMSRALAPGQVTSADILSFDLDGKAEVPKGQSAYLERFIHAEIYRARPDVNSVIHSHSPGVIPFSDTKVPLRAMMHTASFLANGVPVFEIREKFGMTNLLVDNPAKGKALAEVLGNKPVVLMRGHGDAVVGSNLHEAVSRAIYTQIDARLQLEATQLGGPVTFIAPEEAAAMARFSTTPNTAPRGRNDDGDRAWNMWKEDAETHR